jgi:cytidylate kinase
MLKLLILHYHTDHDQSFPCLSPHAMQTNNNSIIINQSASGITLNKPERTRALSEGQGATRQVVSPTIERQAAHVSTTGALRSIWKKWSIHHNDVGIMVKDGISTTEVVLCLSRPLAALHAPQALYPSFLHTKYAPLMLA